MKDKTMALFLAFFAFAAAGCNTTRGIGEDIEALGETVAKTAEETEEGLSD